MNQISIEWCLTLSIPSSAHQNTNVDFNSGLEQYVDTTLEYQTMVCPPEELQSGISTYPVQRKARFPTRKLTLTCKCRGQR
jgi:hypothetical protein